MTASKLLPFVLCLFLVLFAGPAVSDTVTIADDGGGVITNYIAKYQSYSASGTHVVIDRYCASSCTLFIGIVRNACVTKRAVLGFHGAWGYKFLFFGREELPASTEVMLSYYTPGVRAWIDSHGGIRSSRVMRLMRYPDTAKYFHIC